jgi:hypothetical protein
MTTIDAEIQKIGTYTTYNEAVISIPIDSAQDYAQMRASQLHALNAMMIGETYEHFSADIRQNAQWLSASLSGELAQLIKIVAGDVKRAQ